jgi:hypothetical protein
MAASTLHASAGLIIGAAVALRSIKTSWHAHAPLGSLLTRWIVSSYALALWATLPAILRRIGLLSDQASTAFWTNIFLGYGLIERAITDGSEIGTLLLATIFTAQYALILASLIRLRK